MKPFLFNFDVNHGRRMNLHNTQLSVYLLSPNESMKRTFGFSDELLLIISGYANLQLRTFQAVEDAFSHQPFRGRADPLTYFLVGEDPNLVGRMNDYLRDHPQSRTPIVIPWSEAAKNLDNRWYVTNKLSTQLFARDIFDYQLPLDNDMFFFGRGKIVEEIIDSIRKSQNIGLFGLRKTGKTSSLFKVKRSCEDNKVAAIVYVDCKRPNIREMSWRKLLRYITQEIAKILNLPKKSANEDLDDIDYLRETLKRSPKLPVCIIFDEIEFISPISPLDKHWKRDFIDFWQSIWSVQSEIRKLSIVVAGVNPFVCEIDLIDGVQNPMFGIVKELMLTGLNSEELTALVRRMGRQMGLTFDDEAVKYLFQRYGGHPLLTRMACSFVNKRLMQQNAERPVTITYPDLRTEETTRESDLQFYCRHVVSELKQFYSIEYDLLEKIARGEIVDFLEFAAEPEFIKHLKGYGLIDVDKSGKPKFRIPVIQRYVAVEAARKRKSGELRAVLEPAEREEWLARRKEGILHDLKQLLRAAEKKGKKSPYGGTLLLDADRFAQISVCKSWENFSTFINASNQTLVETVDHVHGKKFFYQELEKLYPHLFSALVRVRLLRNNADHIKLHQKVESNLEQLLEADLFGRTITSTREPWFLLQQIVMDETFAAIQYEIGDLA